MTGAFQKRVFQALAYQVGRLLRPRQLTCVARIVPRGAFACAARGPTLAIAARGPELAHLLRLSTATTPRLNAELERRGPYLRASAVERSAP